MRVGTSALTLSVQPALTPRWHEQDVIRYRAATNAGSTLKRCSGMQTRSQSRRRCLPASLVAWVLCVGLVLAQQRPPKPPAKEADTVDWASERSRYLSSIARERAGPELNQSALAVDSHSLAVTGHDG